MDFDEHPLLNTPHLSIVLLRTAAKSPATLADCAARLEALFDAAGEHVPVPPAAIRRQLDALRADLTVAGFLAPAEGDRFALTPRGRRALAEHPTGLDLADLMDWPEYAAHVRRLATRLEPGDDPHATAYDQGVGAFLEGRPATDNPHPPDTADHLAWENGWSEAQDLLDPPRRVR